MSEAKAEVIPIKPSTLVLVGIFSAILTFIGAMWHLFVPFPARCTLVGLGTIMSEPYEMSGMPFIVLSFVMPFVLFSPAIRKRVNLRTLSCIYIVALCASGYAQSLFPWCDMEYYALSKGSSATPANLISLIPDTVAVPTVVANSLILGGVSMIPWGTWLPVMIWSFLYFSLFALMGIGAVNIFRKEWIDVEAVPFPQTMLAHQTLIQADPGGSGKGRKNSFIIGLIIGIAYTAILSMIIYFPWFPDILAWRANTCGPGAQQFPSTSPLAGWPGLVDMNKQILGYAICYLLPSSILFSGWFFWIIYEILVAIAYFGLGAYSGITTIGTCGRVWCSGNSPLKTPPLNLGLLSGGGIIGMGVSVLFFQRNYIANTLKAALGRLSKDGVQSIERDEPVSYRISWAMLVIGFILLIAVIAGEGISLAMAFSLVLMGLLNWLWQSRIYGLSGWHIEAAGDTQWVPRLFWPTNPTTMTSDYVLAPWQWNTVIGRHPLDGWGCSMFSSFGSYRMASLTGTSSKDAFRIIAVTMFVAIPVSVVSFVWGASTFGLSKTFGTNTLWAASAEMWQNGVITSPSTGPPSEWMSYILAGAVLTIVMSFLHARFIWFPHPLGPILAFTFGMNLFGNWTTFLVAWALKEVTLRYGGSKLYENLGIPIAGGIVAGFAITSVLFGIGGILYYYVII